MSIVVHTMKKRYDAFTISDIRQIVLQIGKKKADYDTDFTDVSV